MIDIQSNLSPKGKIRLRVCGILQNGNSIALVKHKRFFNNKHFPEEAWILPGGALEFGESIENGVKREVLEETGILCSVGKLLFIKELIFPYETQNTGCADFHSLTLGFHCLAVEGELKTGYDPEFNLSEQLILETKWLEVKDFDREPLFPPFLNHFLKEGIENGFQTMNFSFFTGAE
ncbi:MAG: NUDIX hydrolase [Chloroherpetonaceae bacterium]|nr:NUDIX hydrolase [Chloroherpetonaceae bacterium]